MNNQYHQCCQTAQIHQYRSSANAENDFYVYNSPENVSEEEYKPDPEISKEYSYEDFPRSPSDSDQRLIQESSVHANLGGFSQEQIVATCTKNTDYFEEKSEMADIQQKIIIPKPLIEDKDNEKDKVQHKKMDWEDYHRLDTIHEFLDDLEYDYPSICSVGCIGKSLEGRDLKILKVSNSDASNTAVWMDAGIHAREWIAPAVCTFVANNIARNFSSLPESITNKDWYFLPVVNPDGYEYSHTKDRMWRKNKAYHGGQCVGVDLNRNFSFGWGGKGSSDTPSNAFYRGPEPFSEPESSAVRDIILDSGIPFKIYLTLHSYGQVILFPFAYRDELCPDYVRLLQGATVMSKAIFETNGNTYKVGISRDVMYGAAGTSNDWSYGAAGIPFCYLIELRSKLHKFKVPKEEIEETGNEILNCVKALMEFVDNYPLEAASVNKY